jgi:anaerobic selenocysteine-containing dehydrogenase
MQERNRSHERTKEEGKTMSESIVSDKMTRRTFLKATAATGAVAAVGDKLFGGPVSALSKGAVAAPTTDDKWVPTACRACRWHEPVRVRVVDGVAVKIDGIPGEPNTQGKICGLAQSGLMMLYNPWRVKTPMKRTNPVKGIGVDPGWVEISWDEALDTVASALKPLLETDSRQFAVAHGFGTLNTRVIEGTFGPLGECKAGAPVCGGGFHLADTRTVMNGVHATDFEYCNYYLVFGGNWQNSAKAPINTVRPYMKARARGMKTIVFDPVQADGARLADEWIQILPGTDHAVALAMVNTLVNELGLVDWEHIRLRTNGPYLIAADGDYARSKTETYVDEYREQLTFGKPYVWDPVDNTAKVFDDPTIKDFALEGTYTVDGVECQPAWQLFREFLKPYTAEWAEPITTVPAVTIRRIAKEYGEASQIGATMTFYDDPEGPYTLPYRPVSVFISKGTQGHYNGVLICRAIGLLRIVTGAASVVGSVKDSDAGAALLYPAGDGVIAPGNRWIQWDFKYPPDVVTDTLIWSGRRGMATYYGGPHVLRSLLHPEEYHLPYHVKARLVNYTNELRSRGNAELVVEALNSIPFTFAISYHFDEPTEMADIVFPESSYLDRWEVVTVRAASHEFEAAKEAAASALTVLRQPVVERLYGRDSMDIMRDIADRLGRLAKWNEAINASLRLPDHLKLDPNTQYEWKDVLDRQLKTTWGDEYGLEWFKVHGYKGNPAKSRKIWYAFTKGPETRLPLYDEFFLFLRERYKAFREENGLDPMPELYAKMIPLPEWQGIWPMDEASPDYDLYAVNFQNTAGFMCMAMDNPWLMEYSLTFQPYHMGVWINPKTARKKGITTGDRIKIVSQFEDHTVYGEALVTEGIHPECLGIAGCYGSFSANVKPVAREGTHFNTLTSSELKHHDPVGGNIQFCVKVKVEKV